MTKLAAAVVTFLILEMKALDFLYYFQIKEYRIDRFAAMIKDNDFVQIFFSIRKLPAKTPRNMASAGIMTILVISWMVYAATSIDLLLATIVGYWIVAFIAALTGMCLTWIPSALRKLLLMKLAAVKLRGGKTIVIGITGSYGKTTTKDYLYEILSQKFKTARTPKNMNTETGVALAILGEVKKNTRFFIAEMGAYKTGEIQTICEMTRPTYAIVTSIGNQHVGLFGNREKLVQAKKELIDNLPKDGTAYINASRCPYEKLIKGARTETVAFHSQEKKVNLNEYDLPPEVIKENLIPCILLARKFGMKEEEIKNGITRIKSMPQRLSGNSGTQGAIIIDNSYNTSREGNIYSIGILARRKEKRKILITRGIIELGADKKETYQQILHVLAKTDVNLYTTDGDFRDRHNPNVHVFTNEESLKQKVLSKLNPDTVILIEGKLNRDFIARLKSK